MWAFSNPRYCARMLSLSAAVFSGLLVVTGWVKMVRPADTAIAVTAMGLPIGTVVVRTLASAEILIGLAVVLTMDSRALVGQALLYAVFLLWIANAMRRGAPIESCGCLGRHDTPPYWGHLALNGIALAISLLAALTVHGWPAAGPAATAGQVVIVGLGVWLGWNILGAGAQSVGATRA